MLAACVADDAGCEFAELEGPASIADGCEEDVAVFCCDDVGVRADELGFRVDDEERRWLLREELDKSGAFAKHDDTARTAELDDVAALLDPARCDDAELELCSEVPALE
jgi:hypothetical protein